MVVVIWALNIFFAALMGLAGVGKLLSWKSLDDSMAQFGVPRRLARSASIALVLVELTLGVAVLIPLTRVPASFGIALLMALFATAVAVALLLHRSIDCNCFGEFHSSPVSWSLFRRDCLFVVLAASLGAFELVSPSLSDRLGLFDDVLLAVVVLTVVVLAGGMIALLRRYGRLLTRMEALGAADPLLDDAFASPRRSAAPSYGELRNLVVYDRADHEFPLARLLDSTPTIILFVSPTCGPCHSLMPEVRTWIENGSSILIIVSADPDEIEAFETRYGVRAFRQHNREVSDACHAFATPSVIVADSVRERLEGPFAGAAAVRRAVHGAVAFPQSSSIRADESVAL